MGNEAYENITTLEYRPGVDGNPVPSNRRLLEMIQNLQAANRGMQEDIADMQADIADMQARLEVTRQMVDVIWNAGGIYDKDE